MVSLNLELDGKDVAYEVRYSSRARRLSITVHPGGKIVVTTPRSLSEARIERFVHAHMPWLERAWKRMHKIQHSIPRGKRDYLVHKESARKLVAERLAHFNTEYGFTYTSITIRNNRSRWGSCSRAGRLNFNYQIAHLPEHLQDYIVVHELCHLGAFDHSPRFWALVSRTLPDHAARRRELRQVAH